MNFIETGLLNEATKKIEAAIETNDNVSEVDIDDLRVAYKEGSPESEKSKKQFYLGTVAVGDKKFLIYAK